METDILRHISFLDDPVAFWRGWEGLGNKPGRPWKPPGRQSPSGQGFGLFHIKNLLTAHTAQPLSWSLRQGCLFFLKGLKRSLFYCKSSTCSLFKRKSPNRTKLYKIKLLLTFLQREPPGLLGGGGFLSFRYFPYQGFSTLFFSSKQQ